MSSKLTWPRDLPVGEATVRRATSEDAGAVAALMADPDVDRWWHQAWPEPRWSDELARLERHGSLALVLVEGEATVGYAEMYLVAHDVLGRHVPHHADDLGMHLALGRAGRGRGLGTALVATLREAAPQVRPGCTRLVAEPDERNLRVPAVFRRAGFADAGAVSLPDKTALLMVAEVVR